MRCFQIIPPTYLLILYCEVNVKLLYETTPHRYRHINQFIDAFETEEEGKDIKERISRKEAVHRVLDIIKKLGLQ
jgi:hypothetical protein